MRNRVISVIAVLIVCVSIIGFGLAVDCKVGFTGLVDIADSDVIIESEDAADCDNDVESFLADYDTMWEILEENYYYFPYLEKQGVDVEALKRSTRLQLESRITDIDGFYYLLESMFRKLQNFAHLSVVEPAVYAVYRKYYDFEDGPAASDNGWKKALQNPKTDIVYEYLEKTGIANKMTGAGQTRDQMAGQEIFPPAAASYDAGRQAVLFKISSFDDRVYSSADSFSAFCRETGWAAVAGRTTRGDGKGTSPVLVPLPETGLLIRFSGLAVESPDGTLNAITGTRPDLQVNPAAESAYDVINEVIDSEAAGS